MGVVVRFAPSPTGLIHIGGMRVALINWLFAKQSGGTFILRIEDTDRSRYKPEFIKSIDEAMRWLGLTHDVRYVQSENLDVYAEAAQRLVDAKKAYYCYCSQEELEAKRRAAIDCQQVYKYDGRCRGNYVMDHTRPLPAIRVDSSGYAGVEFNDILYGTICAGAENIDDVIIMRPNGIPTFVFAVAVDDAHLGVTHVIRGNDHITNTAQQIVIMELMGRDRPSFAHVPLLLNMDGQKLSKRHGAADLSYYRQEGFLPGAIKNYLAYLGGSLGDHELVFSNDELLENFMLVNIGLSPARFDINKLRFINGAHIKHSGDEAIRGAFVDYYKARHDTELPPMQLERLELGIGSLKVRSDTLYDMEANAACYLQERPIAMDCDAGTMVFANQDFLSGMLTILLGIQDWTSLSILVKGYLKEIDVVPAVAFGALRAAIVGRLHSPPIMDVMMALGKEESITRIEEALSCAGKLK